MTDAIAWLKDANGNKCSVEHFGSRDAAQAALDSLKNCNYCTNCSDCSFCSFCSFCSRCSDCSGCSGCSFCTGCSGCSDCTGCSRCSRCSDLTGTVPNEENKTKPVTPIIPNIHAAIYAAASAPAALAMDTWHTCANTHCRAGWAVALAGAEGRALEALYDTAVAAMMIYDASDPSFRIDQCRFFDDNEAALADMKRLAELEAAK